MITVLTFGRGGGEKRTPYSSLTYIIPQKTKKQPNKNPKAPVRVLLPIPSALYHKPPNLNHRVESAGKKKKKREKEKHSSQHTIPGGD